MIDFVDGETKRYHRRMNPRALACPDGVTRIVTLQNWSWDALDFMEQEDGENRQAVINFCWQTASTPHPDIPDEDDDTYYRFASTLEYYIHLHMARRAKRDGRFANDDWLPWDEEPAA